MCYFTQYNFISEIYLICACSSCADKKNVGFHSTRSSSYRISLILFVFLLLIVRPSHFSAIYFSLNSPNIPLKSVCIFANPQNDKFYIMSKGIQYGFLAVAHFKHFDGCKCTKAFTGFCRKLLLMYA